MGLCTPPVRHPWQGHAECWTALTRRRITPLEAAFDMVGVELDALDRRRENLYGHGRQWNRAGNREEDHENRAAASSRVRIRVRRRLFVRGTETSSSSDFAQSTLGNVGLCAESGVKSVVCRVQHPVA